MRARIAPAKGWRRCAWAAGLLPALLSPAACSHLDAPWPETRPTAVEVAPAPTRSAIDAEIYRRAESDRNEQLEQEVRRLRADLRRAEEALVKAESGLRGSHSRADAVSSLAESRVRVERAAVEAPWRVHEVDEARMKLDEAQDLIDQGHFGAALFFVYRASRIADLVQLEARLVAERPGTRFVRAERVNLRAGPSTHHPIVRVLTRGTPVFPEKSAAPWVLVRGTSGSVGWVHGRLLRTGDETE